MHADLCERMKANSASSRHSTDEPEKTDNPQLNNAMQT
jgi:hypothetical protein